MLEQVLPHQSTGLQWSAGPRPLRGGPHNPPGEALGHGALWQAFALMQQQGYPVVVLDGTEQESAANPGLQDLLQPCSGFAHTAVPMTEHQAHNIPTLPAARGMVQLAHQAHSLQRYPLELLYRHVRNHAVVVLLAPAPLLAPLLIGSQQSPIQLVPSQRGNVIRTYRALKQVFTQAGVMPRLTAMRPHNFALDPVLKAVSQCAAHHLRSEPLAEQFDPEMPRQLHRWSLQCLEHCETVLAPEDGPAHHAARSH